MLMKNQTEDYNLLKKTFERVKIKIWKSWVKNWHTGSTSIFLE